MKIKLTRNVSFSYKNRPLIIAEISGNHGGSKKKFLKLIREAFDGGADLVKIQTYEPQDITLKNQNDNFILKKGIWKNLSLWNLYKKACTPFSWHEDAFKLAKKKGGILFSSPFSMRGVDLLEKFDVKIYKIASFEITDLNLIKYIASKKKPIIISTGMASLNEIKRAKKIINIYHNKIIIMHCVSEYPTYLQNTELNKILILKKIFRKNLIGLSDHTNNIFSSIASLPLGIVAIEKHFNLQNNKSPDSSFSIEYKNLKNLKECSVNLFKSLAQKKIKKKITNIKLRRSIFASRNIFKNEKINSSNIKCLRPSIGIPSEYFFKIQGKKLNKKIVKNTPIYFKDIK